MFESNINQSLPRSEDAEQGYISCLLQNTDHLREESALVPMDYLYNPANSTLYQTILDLHNEGKPVELVAISHRLIEKGKMDGIGGPSVIAERYSFVPTPIHLPYYIGILKNKYILRKTIESCNAVKESCYAYQDNIENIGDLASKSFQEIVDAANLKAKTDQSWKDEIESWAQQWEQRCLRNQVSAVDSRWKRWNDMIGGHKKAFIVLMGMHKSGKTSLALNCLTDMCRMHDEVGVLFSYEMMAQDCISRLICDVGDIDGQYVFAPDRATPNNELTRRIVTASIMIQKWKMHITANPNFTIEMMASKLTAIKERYGKIGIVVVDYCQLIPKPLGVERNASRENIVSEISRKLRRLQLEHECTFIVLSQCNQAGESRESKSLEQDAEIVLRVEDKGVKICFARNGTPGVHVPIHLNGPRYRFEESGF